MNFLHFSSIATIDEKYISGQKGYEKTDTVPVIAEEKEKLRAHKTWYTSLYNKLFGGKYQK